MGSRGLVFAAARSSCFPLIVRIALTPRQSTFLPVGDSDDCSSSSVEGGPGANRERAAATSSWQLLEGWGKRPTSSSLGAVSGMVVLPDVRGDEQEARRFDSTTNNTVRKTKQWARTLPGHATSSTFEEKVGLPEARKNMVPRGRRVVLATGMVDVSDSTTENGSCAIDPANGLCILEHGLGLDTKAEGSIGLHEGATLFAQPVAVGGADSSCETRQSRSLNDENGSTSGRRGGNEETGCGDATYGGHVLLLSDRVRSRTHILVMSPGGEVAPAVTGTTEVRNFVLQATSTCTTVAQDVKNLHDNTPHSSSHNI